MDEARVDLFKSSWNRSSLKLAPSTLVLKHYYMYEARETGVNDVFGESLSLLAKDWHHSPPLEELVLRGDIIDPHFGADVEAYAPNLRTLLCS
ncbi:hypothetical protein SCHPADRAFT_744769 [Schizopora paradoxa]|uniref:Uncharacterized protein n=1 Tax=Schizopora paradoxa TaxID=27342 RepID=A0A0H2QZ05_9AGAM|nr:hypothetical protein SCHPADRAFT_744769 [Schizopora paradoxa]